MANKTYNDEFKSGAVKRVIEQGLKMNAVARRGLAARRMTLFRLLPSSRLFGRSVYSE